VIEVSLVSRDTDAERSGSDAIVEYVYTVQYEEYRVCGELTFCSLVEYDYVSN
jgi:hypothetical protein